MEVVQGKSNDKKVVIAQEIAFAKVLAGNNKTLRDRAVKKLKKWLTLRGNGKWAFTEDEFIRIWTGLFYCMWMSDKFLIQEELAELISSLIHCFKKNSQSALLFVKCFNKRILMDWEGLDQYRIDKFNMLVRRFLRQTFVYCKEKNWDESILRKLMGIFYNVVLHRDNSLGFVLHFINIYLEELAKVSKGKLEDETVLLLIEPFARLISRTKDGRIQKEVEEFFNHLMRQTDTGIEFEEKFNAWREQGFPGKSPHYMKNIDDEVMENGNDISSEDEEIEESDEELQVHDEILDPRAGSVHVDLPQIPINIDRIIELLKKHQNSKFSSVKGRRILKCLIQKFEALNRGKFPAKIVKDPILAENTKKKKRTVKNAKNLIDFTERIDEEPIKSEEFEDIRKELEEQEENDEEFEVQNEKDEESGEDENFQPVNDENLDEEDIDEFDDENDFENYKKEILKLEKNLSKKGSKDKKSIATKNKKKEKNLKKLNSENKEIQKENNELGKKKKKRKNRKKRKEINAEKTVGNGDITVKPKKKQKISHILNESHDLEQPPVKKIKRKLNNWQVQELDTDSPEYNKIETQKIIRLERKLSNGFCDENGFEHENEEEGDVTNEVTPQKEVVPAFWAKAKAKVEKKSGKKEKVFMNPFASINGDSKTGRRISFALEKNMAQENEEYLEEVKNSPQVPFDGTKKPSQSALKSGLAPSPINPFYRIKKIKF